MLVTARDHLRGEGSWGEEGRKPAQVCPYFLYFIMTKERGRRVLGLLGASTLKVCPLSWAELIPVSEAAGRKQEFGVLRWALNSPKLRCHDPRQAAKSLWCQYSPL